jgi:probable phosphoglycerate mutase
MNQTPDIPHTPDAPDAPTRFVLIRHGQSTANAARRVQGWGDSPLTTRGAFQAQQLAAWLHANNPRADVLLCSPLLRAQQTAHTIGVALGMDVQMRDDLKEINLGQWEDMEESAFEHALNSPEYERYVGETDVQFAARVIAAVESLQAAHRGQTMLIVSHLGFICTALAYWLDGDTALAWETYGHLRNTSITRVALHGTQARLQTLGEIAHLGQAVRPEEIDANLEVLPDYFDPSS